MIFTSAQTLERELCEIYEATERQWSDARPRILSRLKKARADALKALEYTLDETGSGTKAARVLASGQDAIIEALFAFSAEHLFPTANHSTSEKLSVIATGGYGRGLLAPGSDIDLLFLFPYRPTPWTESMVETILYMMWDLGLKVGHAARSVDECMKLARTDMTIRTALLECRPIVGDPNLADVLIDRFNHAVMRGTGKKFIAAKLEERDERHKRQGRTRYLVEPNVKEGKGGLRDLNTLFWISKYYYRVREEEDLVKLGVFEPADYKIFKRCDDFLWSVRCHLHLVAGRPEERLTFELQREIARRLGYSPRPGMSEVERFMKHYFLIAKEVGDLTRILCAALEEQHVLPSVGLSRIMKTLTLQNMRQLPGDFRVENQRIHLSRDDAFQRDPVNMLRIFEVADAHDLRPHPDILAAMRRSLRLIDANVRADPEANAIFLKLLTESTDPETLLRLMNETGVLGAFVPEFGKVVAMMQFNMYHHYTVDEHLIRSVAILADIDHERRDNDHPLASQLMPHHPEPPRPLRRGVPARHRQGPPGGPLHRRGQDRPQALPPLRPDTRGDRPRRLADRGTPRDVDHRPVARPFGPEDDRPLRQPRAELRAAQAPRNPHRGRHRRRRPARVERLEVPAPADPLRRNRDHPVAGAHPPAALGAGGGGAPCVHCRGDQPAGRRARGLHHAPSGALLDPQRDPRCDPPCRADDQRRTRRGGLRRCGCAPTAPSPR